jgi:hypothetical protein
LLWCSPGGGFSDQYGINDLWQLTDGDFVTITNRHADLPSWFKLHPRETTTTGLLAMRLYGEKKLSLSQKEAPIVDGPNIWRAILGDRLVWVGKQRPGVESDNGVLSVFTFNENTVIIGEPVTGFPYFGGFDQQKQSQEGVELCHRGLKAVTELGGPRSISADSRWSLER